MEKHNYLHYKRTKTVARMKVGGHFYTKQSCLLSPSPSKEDLPAEMAGYRGFYLS